jgi:hypothetical protein
MQENPGRFEPINRQSARMHHQGKMAKAQARAKALSLTHILGGLGRRP